MGHVAPTRRACCHCILNTLLLLTGMLLLHRTHVTEDVVIETVVWITTYHSCVLVVLYTPTYLINNVHDVTGGHWFI